MKRILLLASMVFVLASLLAIAVSAECVHNDNWEIKTGDDGVLGDWEAINTCTVCGVVLEDNFHAPILESLGYSYFEGSFVQGFVLDVDARAGYERYTGKSFEYGIVAGVTGLVGNTPLDGEGNVTADKAVSYDLSNNGLSHFDIKVVNIPEEKYSEKIIACAYALIDGQAIYADDCLVDTQICGVTVNEVVDLISNGIPVSGLYEYRQLTAEEMDILFAQYWMSDASNFAERQTKNNVPRKFASTRMFTRDELPAGSYVVAANEWSVRAELWPADVNGLPAKQKNRPGSRGSGTYAIETLWRDTVNEDGTVTRSTDAFMAFNVSDGKGGYSEQMSPEGIAQVLRIYVPYDTKVEKKELEKAEDVSVAGLKAIKWSTDNLFANKYWFNQDDPTGMRGDGKYYTTELFTKDTLPVGSVIEINEGWLYRAEYWVNSAKVGTRGNMVGTYRILVTDEFWDGISERAFNISTVDKTKLTTGDFDTVAEAFKIYVPVAKEEQKTEQEVVFIPGIGEVPLEMLYDEEALVEEFDKMFGRPLTDADREMIKAYLDFIKSESNS